MLKPKAPSPMPSKVCAPPPPTVNHPPHYNRGKIEVIDFIEDQGLGFHLGNVLKYICRAGFKENGPLAAVEDLGKAKWYLERKIEMLFKEAKGEANEDR